MTFDVAIIGAGPGGAACAATCAAAGLRTLLLERAIFPREKVCGDCINPGCWPIFEALQLTERVRALPHSCLESVELVDASGFTHRVSLPNHSAGEIALKRSHLDQLLLNRAAELGATIVQGQSLTRLRKGWILETPAHKFEAKNLVAADGRNSTVAKLLGLLPVASRQRIGLQTHLPAPPDFGQKVSLQFLPQGYCGVASVGEGQLNLCLVGHPSQIDSLKSWAGKHFPLPPIPTWRSMTPLARSPLFPLHDSLMLVGDAARVVEPFTGEGIYYALASGQLAARHLILGTPENYPHAHRQLYRGRLWINQFSRLAVTHPALADLFLRFARWHPAALQFLTRKVIGA